MAARRRRSPADQRRRALAQNLLVDAEVVQRAVDRLGVGPDDLIVEVGPGRGALTYPLVDTGARVIAVEADREFARTMRDSLRSDPRPSGDVRVIHCDVRRFRWPREPFRVVGNLPFALTTDVLALLLDDPRSGPTHVDVLVQAEVAVKRAQVPPTTLRSAAWAPWWTVVMGERVPARAFRPVPAVDGAWLHIRRRDPPVLPVELAPGFHAALRTPWTQAHG